MMIRPKLQELLSMSGRKEERRGEKGREGEGRTMEGRGYHLLLIADY